jgi:hypothetical protein
VQLGAKKASQSLIGESALLSEVPFGAPNFEFGVHVLVHEPTGLGKMTIFRCRCVPSVPQTHKTQDDNGDNKVGVITIIILLLLNFIFFRIIYEKNGVVQQIILTFFFLFRQYKKQ